MLSNIKDAPAYLLTDPETLLEWSKWVGREVYLGDPRRNIIGIVVEVRRKHFPDFGPGAGMKANAEKYGDLWLGLVRWTTVKGVECSDLRSLQWLTSLAPDLDTRVVPVDPNARPARRR